MAALPFLIIYIVPASVVAGAFLGGAGTYLTPLLVFFLIPLADAVLGVDTRNPVPEATPNEGARGVYRAICRAAVPIQVGLVCVFAWVVSSRSLTPLEIVGLTLSVGITTGAMGITIAHELAHRANRLDRALADVLLLFVCYLHWGIEHVHGHHRNVATPLDPASARKGESVYRFWMRSVFGSLRSAYAIEATRIRRKRPGAPRLGLMVQNRVVSFVACGAFLAGGFALALGPRGAVFFLAQSLVAITLLEIVNYVEHYGLQRRPLGDGRYERVTELHSWNASHRVTNYFLFNLQRHSDHHAYPQRPYETLRHFDESPQLPQGYAAMVLLALLPPVWRRVMDPRVAVHEVRLEKAA